ncbi:MAG: hypothetical protein AAF431_01655 [Pseudomonadota bacterium]
MTEQQIEQLKSLLADSADQENSKQLDERILTAAAQTAQTRQTSTRAQASVRSPFGSLVTASLAVLFTGGVFLLMSNMVAVDEPGPIAQVEPDELKIVLENQPSTATQEMVVARQNPKRLMPEVLPPTLNSNHRSKDEILAELDIPSADALLDTMEFSLAKDRPLARQALESALADINLMLNEGDWDDARKRYDRLRRSCMVCTLPPNLESLALNTQGLPGRG